MNNLIETGGHLESWLAENIPPEMLLTPLSDELAKEVVDRLKQEADRHWFINADRSIEFANRIIAIGNARKDAAQAALGWMAHGDALRWSGHMKESWETLERAGGM